MLFLVVLGGSGCQEPCAEGFERGEDGNGYEVVESDADTDADTVAST